VGPVLSAGAHWRNTRHCQAFYAVEVYWLDKVLNRIIHKKVIFFSKISIFALARPGHSQPLFPAQIGQGASHGFLF